jgi:tRNA dimethylallyltransferase
MMLLDPPRDTLRNAIEKRFTMMLAAGAVQEAAALLALRLDPALPALRAVGMPELAAYLQGTLTLEEARRRAVLASGQYAKRQATWFRRRAIVDPCATHTIHARFADRTQFSESVWCGLMHFIKLAGRRIASEGVVPGPLGDTT